MTEVLIAPASEEVSTHTKTRSSGIVVETKDHEVNALHAVCDRPGGGFDYFRYDRGAQAWRGPLASAGTKGNAYGPAVYLGTNHCLDALYREVAENREIAEPRAVGTLYHVWSESTHGSSSYPWVGGRNELPDAKDVVGPPAICRWNYGFLGTEAIAPVAGGGFRHWFRNDIGTWYSTVKVFTNHFSGLAMVLGSGKWLYVVAVDTDGMLRAIHRDGDQKWHSRDLGKAFTGRPALVESARGDVVYDLVVPNAAGRLIHYEAGSWFVPHEAARFGVEGRVYGDVGLVFNYADQLEVVARPAAGGPLEHYVNRFDGKGWVNGIPFAASNANGSWNVKYDLKAIGIHATLLRTNEVVVYGLADEDEHHVRGSMIDLNSGSVTSLPHDMPHVFCSGQAQLANGDLLVAGGHTWTEHKLHKFTRSGTSWEWKKLPDLHHGRWYPTVTTMPDGRVLILGGAYKAGAWTGLNNSYEIFDPNNESDPRTRIDLWDEIREDFCDDSKPVDMYPFVFVLPNQRVFVHSRYTTRFFEYPKRGKAAWGARINANFKSPRTYGHQGTSVLLPLRANANNDYPSAAVALFGGAGAKNAHIGTPATDTAEIMITDAPSQSWTLLANRMTAPRVMPDAVLLPDGTVLIVSGSRAGRGDGRMSKQPVLSAEVFDPETQTFSAVAPMRVQRLYHAAAVLLPDATVLVTGKCKFYNAAPYDYPEHRGEIFTPPYLLTGNPRPEIAEAPAEINAAGAAFDVKVTGVAPSEIGKLMLIRLGAATHSFNMDQRAVSLPFTAAADKLTATAPKTNWVVPPGYYMLFAVSKAGVPSKAAFVQVDVFN